MEYPGTVDQLLLREADELSVLDGVSSLNGSSTKTKKKKVKIHSTLSDNIIITYVPKVKQLPQTPWSLTGVTAPFCLQSIAAGTEAPLEVWWVYVAPLSAGLFTLGVMELLNSSWVISAKWLMATLSVYTS